jgi:hypothetical protein
VLLVIITYQAHQHYAIRSVLPAQIPAQAPNRR